MDTYTFNKPKFFDLMRSGLMGPTLTTEEVQGTEAILNALTGLPLSWAAYALATSWHETAHSMMPISEMGGNAYFTRMYDIKGQRPDLSRRMGNTIPGDGIKYRGRGYVQLTWKNNYKTLGEKLGVDLVSFPDRALYPEVASKIMTVGMVEGIFTGKSFKSYLPLGNVRASKAEFVKARYIINGQDKAALIADYAFDFQEALAAAGWTAG